MRWKSQRCCINNYDYDGLGEIPIRDFVCWDLFLVNWMELMIMRMEAMTISQFRPNFTISYWTCWGKEWKMKTVADKRKKWYCHQHQHVNPIWWGSWSRGLVNWAQTFLTPSLPGLRIVWIIITWMRAGDRPAASSAPPPLPRPSTAWSPPPGHDNSYDDDLDFVQVTPLSVEQNPGHGGFPSSPSPSLLEKVVLPPIRSTLIGIDFAHWPSVS